MDTTVLIQVENLSYAVKGQLLIQDLSFVIKKDEIVSIIGYNGSGKSTLLKLLLGSIQPATGTITKMPGLRLGYVPQKLSFIQDLPFTVQDFLSCYNTSISQPSQHICSLLTVEALLEKPLSGLSGGELQKVLMYNALLGNPSILLLDEPTAGLDIRAQEEFYKLIEHIHEKHGITIILVSHDVHTVYSKSDMVICLHQGVCCLGSPHDEDFSKEFNTIFGGYVIPYLHTHSHDHDR